MQRQKGQHPPGPVTIFGRVICSHQHVSLFWSQAKLTLDEVRRSTPHSIPLLYYNTTQRKTSVDKLYNCSFSLTEVPMVDFVLAKIRTLRHLPLWSRQYGVDSRCFAKFPKTKSGRTSMDYSYFVNFPFNIGIQDTRYKKLYLTSVYM